MKSYGATLWHGIIYLLPYVVLTFESVGEQNKPLQGYWLSIFITRTERDKKDLSTVFGLSILSLLRQTFINPLSPNIHKQILQTDLYTCL